tara:strand:+ start:2005 stop:2778 length:774 start_codon:yes stop_codon:yes gene_type:complete
MKVLVIFGSKSDEKAYNKITNVLDKEKIKYDLKISSAHKTPLDVDKILTEEYNLIIAGAGLAAHLPGVVASKVLVPVIGVPCQGNYQGLDALLSIAQMPPGIPVLSVGVDKGDIAAKNAKLMLNKFNNVTIIGDKTNKVVKKATDMLKQFGILFKYATSPNKDSVNINFTFFDEPIEKQNELVIYCPLSLQKDQQADTALNFLKHSNHGLWVGLNNGKNAALAAIEILNVHNEHEDMLFQYRKSMEDKIMKDNKGLK